MELQGQAAKRSRMIGSATARLVNHGWVCPECADAYGRHTGRACVTCSPPRNPRPQRDADEL